MQNCGSVNEGFEEDLKSRSEAPAEPEHVVTTGYPGDSGFDSERTDSLTASSTKCSRKFNETYQSNDDNNISSGGSISSYNNGSDTDDELSGEDTPNVLHNEQFVANNEALGTMHETTKASNEAPM